MTPRIWVADVPETVTVTVWPGGADGSGHSSVMEIVLRPGLGDLDTDRVMATTDAG